jgi:phage repressor protein C with HTH and peptisase S24 domain
MQQATRYLVDAFARCDGLQQPVIFWRDFGPHVLGEVGHGSGGRQAHVVAGDGPRFVTGPHEVVAQLVTSNTDRDFERGAETCGDGTLASDPLADSLGADAEFSGECGLTALELIDCGFDVHTRSLKHRFRKHKHRFLPFVGQLSDYKAMLDNETMAKRVREAIERSGHTQESIATAFGVTEQAVSGWVRTGKIDKRKLPRLAELTGVALGTFMSGATTSTSALSGDDVTDIRGVRQQASLGDGSFHDEYAETNLLKFRTSSLQKKGLRSENLVVYYGDGESMEPRIQHGDALLFDLSDKRPVDGQIYLFSSVDTGLTVKRLVDYGGRWFLEADNKLVKNWTKAIPMDGRHPYVIEGRLRWIGSWEG